MASSRVSEVIQHFGRIALRSDGAGLTDGQLLSRYIDGRDEDAFAALVKRHAPMVWGVCRRLLSSSHDAEDALQATFLVLVRKAAAVVPRENVGNWLYGVASVTAQRSKAATAKRYRREKPLAQLPETAAAKPDVWGDLCPHLDRELSRLPAKYRAIIILCDLEGKTRREAARQFGLPEGTVASRLARARSMLAKRLAGHGFALSGGALAAVLSERAASAGVPASVFSIPIQAASRFTAGQAMTSGAISMKVAALTEGVLKSMFLSKLQAATVGLLLISTLLGGARLLYPRGAQPFAADMALAAPQRVAPPPKANKPPIQKKAVDTPIPRVWKQTQVIKPQRDEGDQVFCAAFSPDGKIVASGLASGTKLSDAATGRLRAKLTDEFTAVVAFSPDGKILATGHLTTVKLWDVDSGKELAILEGHAKNCHSVAFSPDGKTLATASETIRLWDVATGAEIRQFASQGPRANGVYCLAFSPDGKKLASAEGSDKTVKLWDVANGKELRTLKGHTQFAISVAFSPDGKTVASGGGEEEIKLWDIATGKERLTLKGPTTGFHSLAYSPDGKVLASAEGGAKTVQLWEVATGKKLARPEEHTKQVWTVAFSRGGDQLVTAGDDAVRLWKAEKGDALKQQP